MFKKKIEKKKKIIVTFDYIAQIKVIIAALQLCVYLGEEIKPKIKMTSTREIIKKLEKFI